MDEDLWIEVPVASNVGPNANYFGMHSYVVNGPFGLPEARSRFNLSAFIRDEVKRAIDSASPAK